MLSLNQLEQWFRDTERILTELSNSAENLKRISEPVNEREKLVLQNDFFIHFREQLVFILVVQLCKLYVNSDIERRNYRKLINRLNYEPYDNRLKKALRKNRGMKEQLSSKAEIKEFLKPFSVRFEEKKELIRRIKMLRDRVYAHSDPERPMPQVKSEELFELTEMAVQFFSDLKFRLFGTAFSPDEGKRWRIGPVIEKLSGRM